MSYAILVTWRNEGGEQMWHICRGYTDYDAFDVYTMFCARQTEDAFFENHTATQLGREYH